MPYGCIRTCFLHAYIEVIGLEARVEEAADRHDTLFCDVILTYQRRFIQRPETTHLNILHLLLVHMAHVPCAVYHPLVWVLQRTSVKVT